MHASPVQRCRYDSIIRECFHDQALSRSILGVIHTTVRIGRLQKLPLFVWWSRFEFMFSKRPQNDRAQSLQLCTGAIIPEQHCHHRLSTNTIRSPIDGRTACIGTIKLDFWDWTPAKQRSADELCVKVMERETEEDSNMLPPDDSCVEVAEFETEKDSNNLPSSKLDVQARDSKPEDNPNKLLPDKLSVTASESSPEENPNKLRILSLITSPDKY